MKYRKSIRFLTALTAIALLIMVTAGTAAAASRSVFIPGRALGPLGSAALNFQGLLVPPGFMNGATGQIDVPSDWDGVSDFTVSLYFTPASNDAGIVSFFIRPTGRSVGQFLGDPGDIDSPGVNVPASSFQILFVQSFTVSGRVSATDEIFHLYAIQRGGSDETFPGSVTLLGVKISYN